MSGFLNKIRYSKYGEEKKRLLLFAIFLIVILFLAAYLFRLAYARYETKTRLNGNIGKALYLFGDDVVVLNLFEEGIVPRAKEYVYKFSVSNFNGNKQSDVDIKYDVSIRTTTNLPITLELYRNEEYTASGARNLFEGVITEKDENGAWYKTYRDTHSYQMAYKDKVTDIYTVVVRFPSVYAKDTTYANYLENIELTLKSKQVIGEE